MEPTTVLFGVAVLHLVALILPGPDFLVVTRSSLRSRGSGVLTAVGVGLSQLVWAVAAILGLSAILSSAAWLYGLLKIAGALYLIWLGVKTWLGAKQELATDTPQRKGNPIWVGLMTNLTNPKAVVFYGTIFSTAIPADAPAWVFMAVVALVVINTIIWFSLVALVFSTGQVQSSYLRLKKWIDRTAGAIMVFFGVRLAFSR
jgi:threonine efflux protein